MPTPKKSEKRGKRAATVIVIPKVNNRIYGNDVPMPWKEAAVEAGIPERSFWALIGRREITKVEVGKRVMIRPSAVREYLKRRETVAI